MLGLTKDMLTGINRIDDAHHNIVEKAHNVLDAFKKGEARRIVNESIDFLEDYMIEHFHDEEQLQIETHYPFYEAHLNAHEELLSRMVVLASEFDADADSVITKKLLIELIFEIFFDHIRVMDKGLAEHIRQIE